jgi:uncharacterized repeat protein (TIGR03803 family)
MSNEAGSPNSMDNECERDFSPNAPKIAIEGRPLNLCLQSLNIEVTAYWCTLLRTRTIPQKTKFGGLMNNLGWFQNVCLFLAFCLSAAHAQTYLYGDLHSFTNSPDGANPGATSAGLVLSTQGNIYGTTNRGGTHGSGTIFEINASGNESVLYSFCSLADCADGAYPQGALVFDSEGNLYGTTSAGGPSSGGTVFELNTKNELAVLYAFCSKPGCADGESPTGSLTLDAQNNLYGTTEYGGSYTPNGAASAAGTVFKLDASGNETVLYSFCSQPSCADGAYPQGGLVMDSYGNLYGTTPYGGDISYGEGTIRGYGTVFKIDSSDSETVLYGFTGVKNADGRDPNGGLIIDAQGNLYGTTYFGGIELGAGTTNGIGTVFKVSPTGEETVLHIFKGQPDGKFPEAGLAFDNQGNLYGTTYSGGNVGSGQGTLFEVTTNNVETVLYNFSTKSPGGGNHPSAGVVLDAQDNIYGVTNGGADKVGTVFDLLIDSATTTTLTSTPNPSASGETVVLTATVTGGSGTPANGETVSLMSGKTVLGTAPLNGGTATFSIATLKTGTTSLDAVYGGDTLFSASTSNTVKQKVTKAAD